MKTIALCVLAYEGPLARSYLHRLRLAGLRPQEILLMVLKKHPGRARSVGSWLPAAIRKRYARRVQELSLLYWPRHIAEHHSSLVRRISDSMLSVSPSAEDLSRVIAGSFHYASYGERVTSVLVDGLRDPALPAALSQSAAPTVLYTGGGIVPRPVLHLPERKIIHIHPGHLPLVRGADGLLWSILTRGRPGVSSFYMNAGIDTGGIIAAEDHRPLQVDSEGADRPNDLTLYRALFSFVDPVIRAEHLIQNVVCDGNRDLYSLPSTGQTEAEGVTYHFMHEKLRSCALHMLFPSSRG